MTYQLHRGDCLDILKTLADASVHSIVTDPPYHLKDQSRRRGDRAPDSNPTTPHARARVGDRGFMGKNWDGGNIAHSVELWAECLRVLKPGGHLLAFSGTRTQHRMVCAIEDAGFDIRDQIGWIYGGGFPKSKNLNGASAGWGTALKPAWEPICVARKPMVGTVSANMSAHGVGALNIDQCRVPTLEVLRAGAGTTWDAMHKHEGRDAAKRDAMQTEAASPTPGKRGAGAKGRWPANLIHDGSEEVLQAFADFGNNKCANSPVSKRASPKFANCYSSFGGAGESTSLHEDAGSAARFFYCAKASRADRNEGCDALPRQPLLFSSGTKNPGSFQSVNTDRAARNHHPTVKPTTLMRYLCRLVTPIGGTVLDIFVGSGSTGKGAVLEGFNFIGIDSDADEHGNSLGYLDIADARIGFAARQGHQPDLLNAPTPTMVLMGTESLVTICL